MTNSRVKGAHALVRDPMTLANVPDPNRHVLQMSTYLVVLLAGIAMVLAAACLYAHYALTRPIGASVPVEWPTMRIAASMLLRLYPLATYTAVERSLALALSALVVGGIVWAWVTRAARDAAAPGPTTCWPASCGALPATAR